MNARETRGIHMDRVNAGGWVGGGSMLLLLPLSAITSLGGDRGGVEGAQRRPRFGREGGGPLPLRRPEIGAREGRGGKTLPPPSAKKARFWPGPTPLSNPQTRKKARFRPTRGSDRVGGL